LRITYVYSDTKNEWNSSEWRCAVPAEALNRTGRHRARLLSIQEFVANTNQTKTLCSDSDVIVVQRSFVEPVIRRIQQWQNSGVAVIGDFEDAFNLIPKSCSGYNYWKQGKILTRCNDGKPRWMRINPHPIAQFKKGLGILDAVTVSSEMLAEDWKEYNPSIHYLPNYILVDRYKTMAQLRCREIVIGWGGSASHLESFQNSKILPALQEICKKHANVRVMICGNDPLLGKKMPVPPGQLIQQPFVPVEQWPHILGRFDIGIAPLCGEYDNRRSWIKVLEYLVMSIPWVATKAPPYTVFNDYGFLVDNTAAQWIGALDELIENMTHYKAKAELEAYQFGVSQDINKNVSSILNIYRKYVRRPERSNGQSG
jgi:glycosyltransferase involved in cell wall biosynthesis